MGLFGDGIPTLGNTASGFPIFDTDEMRRRSHASQIEAAGLQLQLSRSKIERAASSPIDFTKLVIKGKCRHCGDTYTLGFTHLCSVTKKFEEFE